MAAKGRAWEVWHDKATVERVDSYWRGSPDEAAHRRRLAALVREVMPAPASILEVGCGTGLVYEALREAIGVDLDYRGIDNSKPMLARAIKRFPLVDFAHGDAFKLSYPPGAFDLLLAFEVFGHMPDFKGPLDELIRVAKYAAIFTLWVGGTAVTLGQDHYEYPENVVAGLLDSVSSTEWTMCDYGPVRAYVVRKAWPKA